MFRRSLISLGFVVLLLALITASVIAQTTPEAEVATPEAEVATPEADVATPEADVATPEADVAPTEVSEEPAEVSEEPAESVSITPIGGGIVQAIPLTLTVNLPGPDGMQSIEVPILLSLDIQIVLGNVIEASVVVTPEVGEVEAPAVEPVEPDGAEPETDEPAADEPEATQPAATEVPEETPTETAPEPTPAPTVEPTAEPTEVPPTAEPPTPTPEPDVEATPEPEADITPEPEIEANACTDDRSIIFDPEAGEVVSGLVEIYGNATHQMFNYYKLEYLPVGVDDAVFAFIMDNNQPVFEGLLAELDTTELDNGVYILRLTVVDNTGNFPPQCSVPVEIAN